jgi:hypothetical protein
MLRVDKASLNRYAACSIPKTARRATPRTITNKNLTVDVIKITMLGLTEQNKKARTMRAFYFRGALLFGTQHPPDFVSVSGNRLATYPKNQNQSRRKKPLAKSKLTLLSFCSPNIVRAGLSPRRLITCRS